MKKVLIVGNGGRESSIVWKLSGESVLYAVMQYANPSIIKYVEKSGGEYIIAGATDKRKITAFAKSRKIDLAFITTDAALEVGIVDALKRVGIAAVGPTRRAAEIEWNKVFAMELMRETMPQYTPQYWTITDEKSLDQIFKEVTRRNLAVVVKPQGLTGGKGVKVMGEHLKSFSEAKKYARSLLIRGDKAVVLEEKLSGVEFTLQVFTDGENIAELPASYDHPYRFPLDRGPGTGGMGSFTDTGFTLPFMKKSDYRDCIEVVTKTLAALKAQGLDFSGVLYPGFFLTKAGIKIMEFNARPGDPECMNIMALLDCSLLAILTKIAKKVLKPKDVKLKKLASVVKYLVSPEYAIKEGREREFFLDVEAIERTGVHVFFSSAVAGAKPGEYKTVGNSRVAALVSTGKTISEAAGRIEVAIKRYVKGPLEWRKDIGTAAEIKRLSQTR